MSPEAELSASEQAARAKLRELFLRGVSELCGEPCSILTYEQTVLKATYSGWQPDGTEILVTDMKTPSNAVIPSALLRTPDVLALQFERFEGRVLASEGGGVMCTADGNKLISPCEVIGLQVERAARADETGGYTHIKRI